MKNTDDTLNGQPEHPAPAGEVFSIGHGRDIDRRLFLSRCGYLIAGVCVGYFLPSCGSNGLSQEELNRMAREYYGARKGRMLGAMADLSELLEELMAPEYGAAAAAAIAARSVERYREMLETDLPFIGGDENYMQGLLNNASMSMAFCLAMKEHGKSIDDAGRFQYAAIEIAYQYTPVPPDVEFNPGKIDEYRQRQIDLVNFSQKRRYPYNWVSEFVADLPPPFDYGSDNIECGNLKICEHYGIREFTNYLCMLDQILYPWRGQGLVRTKTLAGGDSHCDFRYRHDGVVELKEPFTVSKLREWGKIDGDNNLARRL